MENRKDLFTEILMGEPDFYDPDHWCEQQRELPITLGQSCD
jgi:hypothetical protein